MTGTFPEFHPLHKFNDFVYLDGGSPAYPVYIFKWNDRDGTIVSILSNSEYFKAVVKPIIFQTELDWSEDPKQNAYIHRTMNSLVEYLDNKVAFKVVKDGTSSEQNR